MKPLIHYENVHIAFGKNRVLRGLYLDVYKGETLGIIGGSGSGKSISLKLLLGVAAPDKGEMTFQGEPVHKMDEAALIHMRKRFGVVFQGSALFDSLTVKENVAYPLREHFNYSDEELENIVSEKLRWVGLHGIEEMLPADLSGGMQKRVAIARAIATNPEVILYDEPLTGLDPTNKRRVNDLILRLQDKLNMTAIMVTHDMESAFQVSNRLALLKDGRICFAGTVKEAKMSKDETVRRFIEGKLGDDRLPA